MKFSDVAGVTNFKPDFLGKKGKKICHQKSAGFFTRVRGCKNPKFHHLDLLGPPSLKNFLFSREKRPEFRRNKDLYKPLLTAMAQVLPVLN